MKVEDMKNAKKLFSVGYWEKKDENGFVVESGVSGEKELIPSQLTSLFHVCKDFMEKVSDGCVSHALYRCRMYSDDNLIRASLFGSNIDGNLKEVEILYDLEHSEFVSRGVKFENSTEVGKSLYKMIYKLTELLPFYVGMLDFPLEGKFKKGSMMAYKYEEGTYLIYIEDTKDYSYLVD